MSLAPPLPHRLVLTIHETGWMAGCHCGAAFKMPPGLYDDRAHEAASRFYREHLDHPVT